MLRSINDGLFMQTPPLDPPVADTAPTSSALTAYDQQHLVTYLRLLDAEEQQADWREVAKLVLHRDPNVDVETAQTAWQSHLARAHWLRDNGFRHLLRGGSPN
jgi:hypothetical protein